MTEKLGKVYEKTFAEIRSSLSGDTYANVHDWMQAEYLANPAQLMSELKELEGECRQILGLPGSSNIQSTVPDSLVTDQDVPRRFKLALWQFGFLADSQLKGPVQSYAVSLTCTQRDNLQKLMVFKRGSEVQPFTVALAIGSATVMSCFLFAIFSKRLDILAEHITDEELQRELALRLMKTLVLHTTSSGDDNPDRRMLQSLGEKRAAAQRTHPSPFQHWSREQRLRDLIREQNASAVSKARVGTEEMSVMIFLDSAGPETRKIIAAAHQSEAPQFTAFPLSLLTKDFLHPKKEENPVWHAIHGHSWEKVEWWARRVYGKWEHKISQVIQAGQVPAVKSSTGCAPFRDSGKELEIYCMAQLMQHYNHAFVKMLPQDRYKELMTMWNSGLVDSKVMPAIMAKRKEFEPRDLAFLALQDDRAPRNFLNPAGTAEKQEALKRLVKQLQHEQRAWRVYLQKAKASDDMQRGDWNVQVARQQERLEEAWQSLSSAWCVTTAAKDLSTAMPHVAAHRHMLADAADAVQVHQVVQVFEWNIPKAGGEASKKAEEAAKAIALSCSTDPQMAIHIVIPPCQPCYGKMDSSGDERVESTARHVELWLDQLSKPEHKLLIRKVRVTWSAETFYSPERELAWEAWITLSSTTRVPNKASSFNHVLGNSPLLKRGAFPVFINAMARKDFRNWKVPLGFDGAGGSNNALSIEQLQWFSGSELHSQFLRHLFMGSSLGKQSRVQVIDMFLLDDQPGTSVVDLNCLSDRGLPQVGYCGIVWIQEKALVRQGLGVQKCFWEAFHLQVPRAFRNVILENVTTSLSNMYKEKLRQKTLLLETGVVVPEVGQGAGAQHTKPEYDPKDFELCWPRANQELPLRQTTVDQAEKLNGISITDSSGQGIQWSSLQKAHNDEFCPSGEAYNPASNKRSPECSTEELQKQTKPAVNLQPAQPPDGLLSTGVATDDFQLILAPDGSLYVKALKDSCLESSAALFLCKGTYKTGATAKAEKGKPGSAFIPSEMSQDTLRHPLSERSVKHKVFEVEGKFKVAATDDVIYQLDVSRKDMDPKAVIAKEALSSYVDYSKLTHLKAIQRVKYDESGKALKQGIPAVHASQSIRLKKDEVYKM
ncbi:unnamed protein product [Effrenium voratum]|uniref:Uncharacterized protein n=1 Tax=Effrenium voratum TaxID=2562239 RepID=A0AA36J197_9DINO|nr:unnamed protein product [Effrenium voratum]